MSGRCEGSDREVTGQVVVVEGRAGMSGANVARHRGRVGLAVALLQPPQSHEDRAFRVPGSPQSGRLLRVAVPLRVNLEIMA